MRVTDEIFQVGGGELTEPRDAAVYLITFGGNAALVDAGCGGSVDAVLENARKRGVAPEAISHLFITHCHFDHTGGAAQVREKTGARTVAHEREASCLETGDAVLSAAQWYGAPLTACPVDVRLEGPEQDLVLGDRTVKAIHIPGHSPGSVAYLAESEGLRVLFGQDVHGPLDPSLKSDPEAYRHSLRKLLALEADVLCEGHFGVYRGKEAVREFIASFLS
ncbi:MAG: MBL fold metallo-hydrolase [Planctomycetota bacterium]|jgi:glyoxylase-like metal-dependent hydrolase (beta-lactamase superfamily II)